MSQTFKTRQKQYITQQQKKVQTSAQQQTMKQAQSQNLSRIIQQQFLKAKDNNPPSISYHERKKLMASPPELKTVFNIDTDEESTIIIPPINTDIEFSTLLPIFEVNDEFLHFNPELPTIFNWKDEMPSDTPEIRFKKKLIQKPANQGSCGSCWVFTTCNAISDHFVVSGIVNWIPDISVTYALTCFPQSQCDGGNPAILIKDIADKGITTNNCIDYSWCDQNKNCIDNRDTSLISLLNKDIPTCGCYYDAKQLIYKIDNSPTSIYINEEKNLDVDKVRIIVKHHIYTKGSVIAGLLLFENFKNGLFAHVNDGIYFEQGIYDNQTHITFSEHQTDDANVVGGHAVSIIGWGHSDNIVINNKGDKETVHYWLCRNTWSEKWGDHGYFKIAMYPWNKISQFENLVAIQDDDNNIRSLGGIILCSVSQPPYEQDFSLSNYTGNKNHSNDYYKHITKCISNGFPCEEQTTLSSFSSNKLFVSISFISILVITIILLYVIFATTQ